MCWTEWEEMENKESEPTFRSFLFKPRTLYEDKLARVQNTLKEDTGERECIKWLKTHAVLFGKFELALIVHTVPPWKPAALKFKYVPES